MGPGIGSSVYTDQPVTGDFGTPPPQANEMGAGVYTDQPVTGDFGTPPKSPQANAGGAYAAIGSAAIAAGASAYAASQQQNPQVDPQSAARAKTTKTQGKYDNPEGQTPEGVEMAAKSQGGTRALGLVGAGVDIAKGDSPSPEAMNAIIQPATRYSVGAQALEDEQRIYQRRERLQNIKNAVLGTSIGLFVKGRMA